MISDSSRFTQKTSTCELCPSPLCPSVYQKQLATGQKLGLGALCEKDLLPVILWIDKGRVRRKSLEDLSLIVGMSFVM